MVASLEHHSTGGSMLGLVGKKRDRWTTIMEFFQERKPTVPTSNNYNINEQKTLMSYIMSWEILEKDHTSYWKSHEC